MPSASAPPRRASGYPELIAEALGADVPRGASGAIEAPEAMAKRRRLAPDVRAVRGSQRHPRDGRAWPPSRCPASSRWAAAVLRWRDTLGGSPIRVRVRDGRVHVTLWLVARPRQRLVPLTAQVRDAVGAAVVRLLGLELGGVTVLVDGVGA